MLKETIVVGLKSGLEARPAALFVQIASKYESHISILLTDKQVNAKSIMGMMSLGAIKGQEITLLVDGEDEEEAMKALISFMTSEQPAE
ncbi:MAG TPA: HPr family phosphocarrier protein [Epulopiscium sp.]|nr:HPr family phosphocarrier protein [Candidatus Epulonipiscium sp.]